jgi:hypothetical protein
MNAKNATRGRVIAALVGPEEVRKSVEENTKLARELKEDGQNIEGLIRDISEANASLEVAEAILPYQRVIGSLLQVGLQIKDEEGKPNLQRFLREVDVMQGLEWELSERIVKRFIARFKSLGQSSSSSLYTDAMMNTIGEFAMVSLGVLDPELFQKQRGEVKALDVLFADQNVDDATHGSDDVTSSMKQFGLQSSGPIYWCRWAMQGVKLSANSDRAVRGLLRDVIGQDKAEVLEAMSFGDFFEELREIKREYPKEEVAPLFGERLGEVLTNNDFLDFLVSRAVESWYPSLRHFLEASRRVNR